MNVLGLCAGVGGLELGLHLAEPRANPVAFMSLEQESYLLCWQAEMSARRLRSALGALRNVHDDFRPCQEVHDAVADYLRSAERAASERGHHYKWLTGGKKYTSPRATDGPPDQEALDTYAKVKDEVACS